MKLIQNSFSSGELSPKLDGRTDIAKYYSGCRTLENMLVTSYGPATKRPGTDYIASVRDSSVKSRLLSFVYSIEQAYILELGAGALRFYMNGGQILLGGVAYEIVTPYQASELFGIKTLQSADTMYLFHVGRPIQKLTRSGHTAWTLVKMPFKNGPFLDENDTETTVTPSGKSGNITLVASADIFDADHYDALWQVSYITPSEIVSGTFHDVSAGETSSQIKVLLGQKFNFVTHKNWAGTVCLQKSYDNGETWWDYRPVNYINDGNCQLDDEESVQDALYRVTMLEYVSGTCQYSLIANSIEHKGIVQINSITDARNAEGTVVRDLGGSGPTKKWSEGAWSAYQGYPSCGTFHEERLFVGGTKRQPQGRWGSKTGDWKNFDKGQIDDGDAITNIIASDQVEAIRWMISQNVLLMGTNGAEWRTGSLSSRDPLTPGSPIDNKRQKSFGSEDIQAAIANDAVIFVQRGGRRVREMVYDYGSDAFDAPNLTTLSEHITQSGIVAMFAQKHPDTRFWFVRDDGVLLAFLYNKAEETAGWSRVVFSGIVESGAVIPGSGEDEVWLSILRTINGESVRYIERMRAIDWGDDLRSMSFLDCELSNALWLKTAITGGVSEEGGLAQ